MKFKLLLLYSLIHILSLTSCNDLEGNNDVLVTSKIPPVGVSKGTADGKTLVYFNPANYCNSLNGTQYFTFSTSGDKINRGVFQFKANSTGDAKRLRDLITSGRWLSDDNPYPLPINVADRILYCTINELKGIINYVEPFKHVVQNWYGDTNVHYNQKINFGVLTELNSSTGEYSYSTAIIFGMKCNADVKSRVKTTMWPDGSREVKLIITLTFVAPSNDMGEFLGNAIKKFFPKEDGETSISIKDRNVSLTHTIIEADNLEELALQRMYYIDSFLHQPMQCLVLECQNLANKQ